MRSVLSSDGNSRTWRAGLPARAVGNVADHRTAPERASSARRPMSVWTTIMSGPACKTSSAVASEAARTRPCIRPPSPFFFGSVCSNSASFTQRCSPVARSYSATTAGPVARRPWTSSVPLCGSTRRVTIWVRPGRRESNTTAPVTGSRTEQARARRLDEQGAFDHADAVGGQPAELGLLPGDLAALDVDACELGVGRDEQRARRCHLLPADVPLQLERPRRGGTRTSRRGGLGVSGRVAEDDQRGQEQRTTNGHGGHSDLPVDGGGKAAPVSPHRSPERKGGRHGGLSALAPMPQERRPCRPSRWVHGLCQMERRGVAAIYTTRELRD